MRGVQLVFVETTCSPLHCLRAGCLRYAIAEEVDVCSSFAICQTPDYSHLAHQSRLLRPELSEPHDLLAGDEFDKSFLEWVRVLGRLTALGIRRILVDGRHSELASFSRLEGVHLASHGCWRKPRGHGVPVNQGLIDDFTRCLGNPC